MLTVSIIAFREFLEAFLVVGIFLGVSKKLNLKKEKEIALAAATGIIASVLLAILTFTLGDTARTVLTEERAESLENYLMLFSGFFLVYVIFSLHQRISSNKKDIIKKASEKLEKRIFDFSLFTTITFLILREGFEISLFTASTSLFSAFFQNLIGLLTGLFSASILGGLTFIAYTKFPIKKVFKITEYMVILLGASMVQVGFTELLEHQLNFHLGDIASFSLKFLPAEDTALGHLIRSFSGVDQEFSLPRLMIMVIYITGIFFLFGRKKTQAIK